LLASIFISLQVSFDSGIFTPTFPSCNMPGISNH